jgi:hypothetical protein
MQVWAGFTDDSRRGEEKWGQSDLLLRFTDERLLYCFAGLDVPTDDVPTVWRTRFMRGAPCEKQALLLHEQRASRMFHPSLAPAATSIVRYRSTLDERPQRSSYEDTIASMNVRLHLPTQSLCSFFILTTTKFADFDAPVRTRWTVACLVNGSERASPRSP